MHRILAEKSVNSTELRKNPAKYFIDQPVAVLSNNRPAGYLLSASAFEALMDMLAEQEEKKLVKARFRPSAARLEEITRRAEQYLNDMTDDDFNDFKE
ncbi:TPA: type I toxin-antitoxin system antitoxin YafN [Escherichia coli]|nr:type I toxin-antitoxin system antitoxin YafN [Escherichia coli]